ncbi:MAG: aspartate/glutamate racemase family protein [Parvibaculum sp.]|uniref:aspartate/glutamate racemase family protein n=1 Tax=Parvibaculum sp. TaxID=2024848 RepID=UPI003C71617C
MPPAHIRHGAAIAFLHTAAIHIETFNELGRELAPELTLAHAVREDLLSAAEKAGFVTPALDLKTQEALVALAEGGARVVVCTCSTLGASAEAAAADVPVPILRIDRAMADLAVKTGTRIGVAACIPATVPNTQTLLRSSAARAGREVEITTFVFDDVWTLFREGRLGDYYEGIASRLAEAARDVDVLVLAQASMAPAAALCVALQVPVLSSPRIGFEEAVRLARQDAH